MKSSLLRLFGCVGLSLAVAGLACSGGGSGPRNTGGTGGEEEETGGAPGTGGAKPATGGKSGSTGGSSGATGGSSGETGGSGGATGGSGGATGGSGGGGTGGAPPAGTKAKTITLDTTAAGAGVMGDVPKYPVAVVLNAMNFDFASAKPKGEDIRFATAEGAALPHMIEFWDATAKQAALWVKVDVKGNASQTIKMTWGDAAAMDASDSTKVFDLADGFTGVWHLSEAGAMTADNYKDSTGNASHAVAVGMTPPTNGDGRIGKALLLANAQRQYLTVPLEKSKLYDQPNKMTYSIWSNAKSHNVQYQAMFTKGEGGFRIHYVGLASFYGNKHITELCVESTTSNDVCPVNSRTGTDCKPGEWHHLVAVHDHPQVRYYVDGKLEAMLNAPEAWKSDATKMVMIGNNSSSLGRAFDGFLDEARLMNVPKDANWIKLEFESQKEGQKFLTFSDPK
jgi:hypothetical protein